MNRKLALVGVLLTLLGGVLGMVAFQVATAQVTVLAVARAVPVGAPISEGDLVRVELAADPRLRPIAASEMSSILGRTAAVDLHPGELLTREQVGTTQALASGEVLVAVPLREGQFPSTQLAAGQSVTVISVPVSGAAAGEQGGAQVSISGAVVRVGVRNDATQVTVVDLRVREVDGPVVARLASAGQAALMLVPAKR